MAMETRTDTTVATIAMTERTVIVMVMARATSRAAWRATTTAMAAIITMTTIVTDHGSNDRDSNGDGGHYYECGRAEKEDGSSAGVIVRLILVANKVIARLLVANKTIACPEWIEMNVMSCDFDG